MKLTEEQTEQLFEYLKDHGFGRACQVCSRDAGRCVTGIIYVMPQWVRQISNHLEALDAYNNEYPVIPVTCNHCGNVALLSAAHVFRDMRNISREIKE